MKSTIKKVISFRGRKSTYTSRVVACRNCGLEFRDVSNEPVKSDNNLLDDLLDG